MKPPTCEMCEQNTAIGRQRTRGGSIVAVCSACAAPGQDVISPDTASMVHAALRTISDRSLAEVNVQPETGMSLAPFAIFIHPPATATSGIRESVEGLRELVATERAARVAAEARAASVERELAKWRELDEDGERLRDVREQARANPGSLAAKQAYISGLEHALAHAKGQGSPGDTGCSEDAGCSEAGNWFSEYGLGTCPIRRAPCPAGCLRRTVDSMKLSIESATLREEVRYQLGRNDGIDAAAKLVKKVGSKSVARAVTDLREPSPGAAAAATLNRDKA